MKKTIALLLVALMICSFSISALAASTSEKQKADALYSLGLFLGIGNNSDGTPNYDLDNNLTRSQAVILLVRLLGKDNEVKSGSYSHPFKDTLEWYDKYVGYAYENKLTNGTGKTTYSGELQTSVQMFTTFCLRALGYDDTSNNPDFTWDKATDKAKELGINIDMTGNFTRGEAVDIFWNTLNTKMKGSNITLSEKLESDGVFSKTEYELAEIIANGISTTNNNQPTNGYIGNGGNNINDGGGSNNTDNKENNSSVDNNENNNDNNSNDNGNSYELPPIIIH